jgi:branched-chain amino acid aminotransferase
LDVSAANDVWINGEIVSYDDASVSVFDHGLLVGDGVFETFRVIDGEPFAITRHMQRLAASAATVGIEPPSSQVLTAAIAELIAHSGLSQARLRLTVTSGPGPLGSARGSGPATAVLAISPNGGWPEAAAVSVVPWPRNERGALAGVKSTSYAENAVALARAHAAGASEAIFANTVGNLCEGTGSNIFVGIGGRLVTPPLSAGCLAGVTRALLLETKHAVEEDLPIETLSRADEAFLTSSTRNVHPISEVDGIALPSCPGPLSRAAGEAFEALVLDNSDP